MTAATAQRPRPVKPGGKAVAQPAELEDPERLSRTAFVGNVPAVTTRKELKRLFKPFGVVENVRLRGVIAANPKLPKKSALLARRLHKDCDTLLAYVVFKRPTAAATAGDMPPPGLDDDDDDDDDGRSGDDDNGDDGGKDEKKAGEGTERNVAVAVEDYTKPSAEVRAACAALNLTIMHDKHLRVSPAMHTRSPIRQSVFLGNLPFDVTEEELIVLFTDTAEEAGAKLVGVRVTRDKETGMGRGIGYVSFDDDLGVRAAMNRNGELAVRGRVLRMERASKEKKRNTKTYKQEAKRVAKRDARSGGKVRAGRSDKRRRDAKSGERVTRKGRKLAGAKKTIVKVKHAARKARQAAAAGAPSMGGTGKN
jgi:RNA recognition motif-containing protein